MQTHRSFITNSRIRYTFESLILSNINSTRLTTSCDKAYQLLAVSGRRRNNIMAKRKRTKAQTMIYKTLHIKQKVEHHES
jgi:hypothetical protein